MPLQPGRSVRTGIVLPFVVWFACGEDTGRFDAAVYLPEDAEADVTMDAALSARPEVRVGLAGGSACDSGDQCLSGACPLGACSDWSHAMRIGIDTSSTGADLREPVAQFPLLVRLREDNFTFSEARPDGADIRFVAADGGNLHHDIERWDAASGVADVWVLVPSIAAASKTNFVTMYWGNALATPTAASSPVFDAFTCVFHMNAAADGVATHLEDVSGHGDRGQVQNPASSPPRVDGIAGAAMAFDGGGTFFTTATPLSNPSTVSISLWFRTSASARAGLAGFGSSPSGSDVAFDRALVLDEEGRLTFGVRRSGALTWVTGLPSYNDGAWHLAVARFANDGRYLFVDGEPVADAQTDFGTEPMAGFWRFAEEPLSSSIAGPTDAALAGNFFVGALDEIRVIEKELSDSWIRLAYATQRPAGGVLEYQRVP
jgi:biopolymer transport protein ExbB